MYEIRWRLNFIWLSFSISDFLMLQRALLNYTSNISTRCCILSLATEISLVEILAGCRRDQVVVILFISSDVVWTTHWFSHIELLDLLVIWSSQACLHVYWVWNMMRISISLVLWFDCVIAFELFNLGFQLLIFHLKLSLVGLKFFHNLAELIDLWMQFIFLLLHNF